MYVPTLVLTASIFALAFGALPPSGGQLIIQNVQTGFVWDDAFSNPTNGNPIIAQIINVPLTGNQQWTLTRVDTAGASGIYTIQCINLNPRVFAHADALPGGTLVAQSAFSVWNITEVPRAGSGTYTISAPFVNLTASSITAVGTQMTMQPFNSTAPLNTQLWLFRPL